MKVSNKQIDKLGKELRVIQNQKNEDLLERLQEYRISHKDALSQVFQVVCEKSTKIRSESITTYRIKRIDSIIRKLDRLKTRQLSKMGDIGGCRCILKNDAQVYKLRRELVKVFSLRKENDYIKTPQKSGYRSLHLYLEVKNESRVIEVQIRNQEDHNWATLVEISDVLFDAGLKEYSRDKRLMRLHFLLSKRQSRSIQEMREIVKILSKYNYVNSLNAIFARNNYHVRKQWMEISNNPSHKFFLIESDRNSIPQIQSYETFENSEKAYFEKYLLNSNSNLLLTHLPTPNYNKISVAYSNFILTTHNFLDECNFILRRLIKKSLHAEEVYNSLKFLNLYYQVSFNNITNYINEYYQSIDYKSSKSKKNRRNKKEKAWDKTLNRRFAILQSEIQRFRKDMDSIVMNSFYKRIIFNIGVTILDNKYDQKLKSVLRESKTS